MNIEEFTAEFKKNKELQTRFASNVSARLARNNLTDLNMDVKLDKNGAMSSLIFGGDDSVALPQFAAADAAYGALMELGVKDFATVRGFEGEDFDPLAANVVYKDGGWIINT